MLNFADRTGYGAFTVLWPQMEGYVKFSYKTGQKCGEGGSMETESMRRKGRQEHGRVCSEIQASIRETYNHTHTHTDPEQQGGGREARLRAT